MSDIKVARESLAATDLYGFNTFCWAGGVANGRRTAARRGIKGRADLGDAAVDEATMLAQLNDTGTVDQPAVEVAEADEQAHA